MNQSDDYQMIWEWTNQKKRMNIENYKLIYRQVFVANFIETSTFLTFIWIFDDLL